MARDYSEVNYNLKEVPCQKPVNGDQFSQGTQDFPFSLGPPNCWNPSRSYFKIDYRLVGQGTKANTNPRVSDMIAMAYNFAGNLYSQINCKFGEQDVSVINTLAPQASALKTRIRKSNAWLQSVGKSIGMNISSNASRLYKNSYGALNDNSAGETQFIFKGAANAVIDTGAIGTSATVEFKVAGDGKVSGNNTLWNTASSSAGDTQVFAGDILVVQGVRYTVISVTDNTNLVVSPFNTAILAPTKDYYFIRQDWENAPINKSTSTIIWQPPCGLFDIDEWLGSGQYRISMVPNANFVQSVVETGNTNYNASPDGWKFIVEGVKFYVYTAKAAIAEGPRQLDLVELSLSAKALNSSTFQFNVPPSTAFISVFVQNNTAGSNTLWPPSMFKALSSNFAHMSSGDLSLSSIQVTYASINKPDTNWTSLYDVTQNGLANNAGFNGQVNQLVQRYYDTFLECGDVDSIGGVESMREWMQNGPIYHFLYSRDITDRSTEVNLNIKYDWIDQATTNIVLAAWYRNIVNFTVSQGLITAVATRPA